MPLPLSGNIAETTPVEVRNTGDTRFAAMYASQRWVVEPGAKTLAPYHAACLWFGDPRAVNIGDRDTRPELQFRTNEIDRLSVRYGLCGDPWYADDVDIDKETFAESANDRYKPQRYKDGRHPNLPRCEVYDLDGTRLITVIDDPEGTGGQEPATSQAERDLTKASVAALQAQVLELQNRLLLLNPEAGAQSLHPNTALPPDGPVDTSASGALGVESRDPEADPSDPAAQASADLPPKERALSRARASRQPQPQ